MYLKAIEIQGFKSFPDKTVLNFGEDLTAIVGPNGSGKSNISDAIRWVMGEQSSKSLRGAKMQDVIFGGTAKRPQMGFAQVTLILDNTDHIFPTMDEAEVAVTRRYYRSGESEFYINRQSVRLRDVTELFMDTGMGKEGYSIIGQGKIDEILSVKSGERRTIFEEAAGISKFRHRKEESERKLQRTEENLVRINDKIAELELQVEPLRDQAEKAKKYLVLRDEMRVLEVSVWLDQLEGLKQNARRLEVDLSAVKRERNESQIQLDKLYTQAEQFGEKMQQKDIEIENIRQQVVALDGARSEQESAIAVLHSTIDHNRENIRQAEQELQEQDDRAGGLQSQVQLHTERISEIDRSCETLDSELDKLLSQAKMATEQAGGAQSEVESLRGKEAIAIAAAADARAEISGIVAENREIEERLTTVRSEQETVKQQFLDAQQKAKENRRALEDAREEADSVSNMIAGHQLRLDERNRKAKTTSEEKMKTTMDVGAMERRIHLLTDMEKEFEGFNKAVRIVMRSSNLQGIYGPVGNLMTTDPKYTVAIEIALGGSLQNIVVNREEDAKAAIRYLKQRDGGRATFLPMTAIHGEELREQSVTHEYGFVGVASQLIQFDPQYAGIFYNLLGRIVIVEDLDCGIAIARKYRNRFRIVTMDGQVINRGGSMTGGSVNRSSGVLTRSAELKKLKKQVHGMNEKLVDITAKEDEANRELTAARYEMETAATQKRTAEDEVLRLEGQKSHFSVLIQGLSDNLERLSNEEERLSQRLSDNQNRQRNTEETIAEQEKQAAHYHAEAAEKLSGQTELMERTNQLAESISSKKSDRAALVAERETTRRNLEELNRLSETLSSGKTEWQKRLVGYQTHITEAEREIETRQVSIDEMATQAAQYQTQLQTMQQEKLTLEAERTAKNRSSQGLNDRLLNLERETARLEQKISAASMEEKQILDRLWEHYELSHSDAMVQRIELESTAKATRRIGELKREIRSLGTPNIGAIEEFDRVNTRYTYLTDQRDDVDKAKGELVGVIEQITQKMTAIFAEQFQLLSESFETTFVELFGGGHAKLELEDENDVLNCGIEIKAQPPGKTLKVITLLSGGEKAFVAIALYFAILKVHPTPFCVMDEIEAALDEANVTRYARYMRRLASKTQFIIITHRRGTMEEADVLYGITMQEQGVSKVLTINMNDMAKELHIK